MSKICEPETLLEAVHYFADPNRALAYAVKWRWSDGVPTCPTCGRKDATFLTNQRKWQCKSGHPQRQFTVKTGTVLEDSPLGLEKWIPAMWMLAGDRNGISSCELARGLGVTQKTAWFMEHRIRLAMQDKAFKQLSGAVEFDETYTGGKTKSTRINPKTGKKMPTDHKKARIL